MKPEKMKSRLSPVWSHSGGGSNSVQEKITAFCAGRDVSPAPACDEALIPYDLATNEASLLVLAESGAISAVDAAEIARGLGDLRTLIESGGFELRPDLEDVHINLESWLRDRIGEAAGRLHSGRSRNDQVACDTRQWHRDQILSHLESIAAVVETLVQVGLKERSTVLPGFSHHQRAFVTTFGHLIASHAEAWMRDLSRGIDLYKRTNVCPLGAAAGFGTSWPIDRDRLAGLLGFEGLVENSLDAVGSRLEVETDVASWVALWMTHCSTLAQDLILFSMEEFRWVRLAPETTTGSSIMPQKRNPDFAEVIKGKTATVHGLLMSLLSMGKGQPSGYHRDSQYSKPIGQEIWREVAPIPEVLRIVLTSMKLDRKRMKEAVSGGFLEAAEWADAIAQGSGLPFRDIYTAIARAVDACRDSGQLTRDAVNSALAGLQLKYKVSESLARKLSSPEGLLRNRVSKGSPNPDQVLSHLEGIRANSARRVREIRLAQGNLRKRYQARAVLLSKLQID